MTLGERLTTLRGARPAREVATAVGITVASLLAYEAGRRVPRDATKLALANYFGVALETVFPIHTDTEEVPNEQV